MNSVQLVGRLTKDPDIRYTEGREPMCIARFSIAVDRRVKKEGGQQADFPSCVAFGKTGQFIEKYFSKGKAIGICGHLQTGSYEGKDGHKVYTTDVVVDNVEFVGSKDSSGSGSEAPGRYYEPPEAPDGGFTAIDDDIPW